MQESSTRVIWVDEEGYPYTLFKSKVELLRYRNHSSLFYKLDEWIYIEEEEWLNLFNQSSTHMQMYDYVKRDHLAYRNDTRIIVFNDEGNIIRKFSKYRNVQEWCLNELETTFYWNWVDNYRLMKEEITWDPRTKAAPTHQVPVWVNTKKRGKLFFSNHMTLYPKMPLSMFYDAHANSQAWFYLPVQEYFDRHAMLNAAKVLVN